MTVIAPILPQVLTDLRINTVDADRYSWIVLSYLVAYTVTVPLTGRLSDYLGRTPIFVVAMILFLVGSVVTARAEGLEMMIAGRTLQGLGGGAMLPVSMALVADVVPLERRAAALGLVAAVDTFGWVLGPVWGAAINALFDSWRAIFWLNVPIGIIAGAVLALTRSHLRIEVLPGRPNFTSALLGTGALTLVSLALSTGGEAGTTAQQGGQVLGGSENPLSEYRWPLLIAGLVCLVAFVFWERRSSSPLLPRNLLRARVFRFAGIANILVGGALIVAMVNAPLVIALLADEEDHATYSAVLLGSFTLLMTIGAILGGRLMQRVGAREIAAAGLVLGAAGFALMNWWPEHIELALMSATISVAGLGLGIVIAPIAESAISSAGVRNYGAASGLVLLARLIGMTLGLAAVTRYALYRLDAETRGLPALRPEPGESTSDFFARQEEYLREEAIPITLHVIQETFLVAAAICLITIPIVLLMRSNGSNSASAESDTP